MSNRFYNENVEKFMSEENKYSDAQIEEIKTNSDFSSLGDSY